MRDQEMRQCAQEEAEAAIKRHMAAHVNGFHVLKADDGPVVALGCGLPWMLFCILAFWKVGMLIGAFK